MTCTRLILKALAFCILQTSLAFQSNFAATGNTTLKPQGGYDLFRAPQVGPESANEYIFERISENSPADVDETAGLKEVLVLTYVPQEPLPGPELGSDNATEVRFGYHNIDVLRRWLRTENTVVTPGIIAERDYQCVGDGCSPDSVCNKIWNGTFQDPTNPHIHQTSDHLMGSWQCKFYLDSLPSSSANADDFSTFCNSPQSALNQSLWELDRVDDVQLPALLQGGTDGGFTNQRGLSWSGALENETISATIARELLRIYGVRGGLAKPFVPDVKCEKIGSYTAIAMGTQRDAVLVIPWARLVVSSLGNINQQLSNTYNELKDAIESLALHTLTIDHYLPPGKKQESDLLTGLGGFGEIFSMLGGFVPLAGPAISAAGTVVSGAGTFISNSIAMDDPMRAQKTFADQVIMVYDNLTTGFDNAVRQLFEGRQVGDDSHSFNITDMMKNGAWVDSKVLTNVSDLNSKIRVEILSRSINALWNTWSSNKRWVLFVTLDDPSQCETSTGPPDSRYCADGGVYYTYNFVEQGEEGGEVAYPWGASYLEGDGLSLQSVTIASAESYKTMKKMGLDPFNFNQTEGTRTFIEEALTQEDGVATLQKSAGQYAGSWTLPVCNASWWGRAWNWNYADVKTFYWDSAATHPPCLCGDRGLETKAWAQAAGMQGFETFWNRCKVALNIQGFTWPDGVEEVEYPVNGGDGSHTVKKLGN